MPDNGVETLSAEELERRLGQEAPDNRDPSDGYALVNVLGEESYEREHIPDSINIPQGEEDAFERRFSRDKEIIVYCASRDCDASPKAARELVRRGFTNVIVFAAGMKAWKSTGGELASGQA